jgi:hypothetical protein
MTLSAAPAAVNDWAASAHFVTPGRRALVVAPAEQQRMRDIAKPVTEKALATYDPAIQKLYASEVERVQKLR